MRYATFLFLVVVTMASIHGPACAAEKMDEKTARQLEAWERAVDELKSTARDTVPERRASRGEALNQAFVVLTGEAINPLFGVTALGMYNYFRTDESLRDSLPLYDQPTVWAPLLVIILLMLFNSTLCEAIPFLKIPLNALGDIVNKAGAVAVLPLVVKMFADSMAEPAGALVAQAAAFVLPVAHAAEAGLATSLPESVWFGIGWIGMALVGAMTFISVWLTFNVVDVLILICPFPGVDAALKSLRLSAIALLTGSYWFSPILALGIALAITFFSLFVAGWSFRLSVFGWLFSTDILLFRRRAPADGPVSAFSTVGMFERHRIPMRSLGRLEKRDDNHLVFSYRPWLVLARKTVALGEADYFSVGRGLINPFLVLDAHPEQPYLRFPPRYRRNEDALAAFFGLLRVVDCGVAGSLRNWLSGQVVKEDVTR